MAIPDLNGLHYSWIKRRDKFLWAGYKGYPRSWRQGRIKGGGKGSNYSPALKKCAQGRPQGGGRVGDRPPPWDRFRE